METKYKCGHIWEDPPELQGWFGEEEMEDECPRCLAKESLQGRIERLREDIRQKLGHATAIVKGTAPREVIGALGPEEAAIHWYEEAEATARDLADVHDRYWQLLTEEEKAAEAEVLKAWAIEVISLY